MNDAALAVAQARFALKGFLREPRTLVYTVVLPLFLLVILNGIFRGRSSFFRLQVPFAVYYTPAIISYQIMLAGYSSLLIAVTAERERGMLKRLRGTPMPSWVFLAGEITRTIAVVAVTVAVLVAVGSGVYHVPVRRPHGDRPGRVHRSRDRLHVRAGPGQYPRVRHHRGRIGRRAVCHFDHGLHLRRVHPGIHDAGVDA